MAGGSDRFGKSVSPEEPGDTEFDDLVARCWWLVEDGNTGNGYNEYVPGYVFACGDSHLHAGVDIYTDEYIEGPPPNYLIYAWGAGEVTATGYDEGGYNRWMQVVFDEVDYSLTLGHLLDGSQLPEGTRFKAGDVWAEVGTVDDGLESRHCHFRAAEGTNWGSHRIPGPCEDIDPLIVWRALGLPG